MEDQELLAKLHECTEVPIDKLREILVGFETKTPYSALDQVSILVESRSGIRYTIAADSRELVDENATRFITIIGKHRLPQKLYSNCTVRLEKAKNGNFKVVPI